MKKPKLKVYMHQPTGNIARLTDKQAAKLDKDWTEVKFIKNEKGERVMRFRFEHEKGVTATVDVLPNGKQEVVLDEQPSAK